MTGVERSVSIVEAVGGSPFVFAMAGFTGTAVLTVAGVVAVVKRRPAQDVVQALLMLGALLFLTGETLERSQLSLFHSSLAGGGGASPEYEHGQYFRSHATAMVFALLSAVAVAIALVIHLVGWLRRSREPAKARAGED